MRAMVGSWSSIPKNSTETLCFSTNCWSTFDLLDASESVANGVFVGNEAFDCMAAGALWLAIFVLAPFTVVNAAIAVTALNI
jgi:hypothetical protein